MKNVIKKIASIAMAFTLLGTGTTVTKTISPKSDNTIVAEAASCKHNCKWYERDFIYLKRNSSSGYGYDAQHAYEMVCSKCNYPVNHKITFKGPIWSFRSNKNLGRVFKVYEVWDTFFKKYHYEDLTKYDGITVTYERTKTGINILSPTELKGPYSKRTKDGLYFDEHIAFKLSDENEDKKPFTATMIIDDEY